MTMTARVNLITTRSSNPASSSVMLAPVTMKIKYTQKIKKCKKNEI
jgi:hypothetical protein